MAAIIHWFKPEKVVLLLVFFVLTLIVLIINAPLIIYEPAPLILNKFDEDHCRHFSIYSTDDSIQDKILYENNVNINIFDQNYYHLSIIFGTRNDNYGGSLIERITTTLRQFITFPWYKEYQLKIEIIITQYNYIPNNTFIYNEPLFIELINDIKNMEYIKHINIKFINVPHNYSYPTLQHLHETLYCPMLEFNAKNIGLRRSKSQWKLVTNQDDFYPKPLLAFIAKNLKNNQLNKGAIYQSPRSSINMTDINKFNNNIQSSSTKCNVYPTTNLLRAGGDFNLFHVSLVSHVGGGYLEVSGHWHLDSEFIIRALWKNKYTSFKIASINDDSNNNYCKPLHIEHERKYSNKYDSDIIKSSTNNYKKIGCDPHFQILNRFWRKFRKLTLNETNFFNKAWNIQNNSWGWINTNFDIHKCYF